MRVFLTGATGYVGREVLRRAVGSRPSCRRLDPESSAGWRRSSDGIEVLAGDLGSPRAWEQAAASADAIIHCALEYTAGGDERSEVDALALGALQQAAGDGGMPFIYTSSLFECSRSGPGPIVESTPQDSGQSWRLRHERQVLAEMPGAAVLRLGFVYGGAGSYVWDLLAPGDDGAIAFAAGAGNRWPFIHVEDLAELYRFILEARAGGIFHGTDGAADTVREAVERVAEITGKPAKEISASEARARLGRIGGFMSRDIWSAAPRSRELGWRPRHPSFLASASSAFRDFLAAKNVPR